MSEKNDDPSAFWILGLLVGLAGGAVAALLTTPKTGGELRDEARKTASSMPGKMVDLLDGSLDLYASALGYLQLLVEEQTVRMRRAVAAGQLAAAKKREELELEGTAVLPFQHR